MIMWIELMVIVSGVEAFMKTTPSTKRATS
jgi:hypothetical protein